MIYNRSEYKKTENGPVIIILYEVLFFGKKRLKHVPIQVRGDLQGLANSNLIHLKNGLSLDVLH